jgi:hypothetical protein
MLSGYIDDGYTLDGFIKESTGIFGAVRFKYRPLTVEERLRVFENWANLSAAEQISRTTSALARQIVQWNLTDAGGRAIPTGEPRNFRRLSPPLHERLLDIICGLSAPDCDPVAEPAGEAQSPSGTNYAETGLGN